MSCDLSEIILFIQTILWRTISRKGNPESGTIVWKLKSLPFIHKHIMNFQKEKAHQMQSIISESCELKIDFGKKKSIPIETERSIYESINLWIVLWPVRSRGNNNMTRQPRISGCLHLFTIKPLCICNCSGSRKGMFSTLLCQAYKSLPRRASYSYQVNQFDI